MAAVAALLTSSTVQAGPLLEVGVGVVVPLPDERDDSEDRLYNEVVHAGPHLTAHLGWLFPVVTHPAFRVQAGPVVSAAHTWYRDFEPNDGLDDVTRWRYTGGARLALDRRNVTVSIEGLLGTDRPTYDFSGLIDALCGDPTTVGDGWEATAAGQVHLGPVVIGASAGVLYGDHQDDQPACAGDIVIDVVDYASVDLAFQLSLGLSL